MWLDIWVVMDVLIFEREMEELIKGIKKYWLIKGYKIWYVNIRIKIGVKYFNLG